MRCEHCGCDIIKPYPEDFFCPNCHKLSENILNKFQILRRERQAIKVRQFEYKTGTPSSKISGVKVKEDKKINSIKEHIEFYGITSKERTPLFSSNDKYTYLLELTNNLDYIATSFLSGDLDKMLLISEKGDGKKCLFLEKNKIIYLILGVFSDRKGDWILKEMARAYEGLVGNRNVNNLDMIKKSEIDRKFDRFPNYIQDYLGRADVLTNDEISYVDKWIRIDYVGLSNISRGVISLLLDDKENLDIEIPGDFGDQDQELEMKEDTLTARILAIYANTIGVSGAYPQWVVVKVGFQKYRFLTFKKCINDFFLYFLSEGNLKKISIAESQFEPLLQEKIQTPFNGDLSPFNELKAEIKKMISKILERKFK
ncbi:MAG: hypothetical protein ACW96X_01570 [Promethearchaeota archaeon]